jgi:hypothetical protein
MQRHRLLGHRGAQPLDLGSAILDRRQLPCSSRSGTDAASASNAPRLATRQAVTIVERSTPYRSADSR